MLMNGMQPPQGQHSWLLNLLAAQQSLRPGMLQMGPNAFPHPGYQGSKFGQMQQPGAFPGLPSQAAMLIQQLQQSQNAGQPLMPYGHPAKPKTLPRFYAYPGLCAGYKFAATAG